MSSYANIKDVITRNSAAAPGALLFAIEAKVTGQEGQDARRIFPLVLGQNAAGTEDMLLCYQYEGYTPQPLRPNFSTKNFRCLKVAQLKNANGTATDTDAQPIVYHPITPFPPLNKMKFKDVKRQNCVDEDHVDVFYS
jgi:hypothetical protein